MSDGENSLDFAIELDHVSKVYRTFDSPAQRLLSLFGLGSGGREFTALHPLSLKIRAGVSLGIVGDNGAGKSTLMHLLGKSHTATTGALVIRGKVLGLLELGVGFHPDFSGHDNIYLYGDMLQLDRSYIRDKYDEILRFSELGDFIGQPLKTYSSGMKVRLAFALVAALDPDVLIIDEALAVGDIHFQKKCIDRMMAFRQAGKTIIFCSHSIYQIGMFCDQVLWLRNGRMEMLGAPEDVLPAYEAYQMSKGVEHGAGADGGTLQKKLPNVERFEVLTPLPLSSFEDLAIAWAVHGTGDTPYHVSISLKMDSGRGIFVTGTHFRDEAPLKGDTEGVLTFPSVPLMGGEYVLHFRVWDDAGLMIYDEEVFDQLIVRKQGKEMGVVRLVHDWRVEGNRALS